MSISSDSSGSQRPSTLSGSLVSTSEDVSCTATCSHEPTVFCDTCSKPICISSLNSWERRSHKFKTTEEVCKDKVDTMAQQLENLMSQGNIQEWVESQDEKLENEFQRVQDQCAAQYKELQILLRNTMEQTFTILEALRLGQERSIYTQTEKQKRHGRQGEDRRTEIGKLSKEVSTKSSTSVSIMKNIEVHQMSIDTINQSYTCQNIHFDKSRLEALERSIQHIYGRVLEMLPRPWEFYEDITINPDNTDKCLMISDGHTQVSLHRNMVSKSYQTEETRFHILAEKSWREGKHYWEVDVENCCNWAVGVVELASGNQLPQKAAQRHLGRDKRSWMLESEGGELAVLHYNHLDTVKEQDVRRLGVFLDMSKGKNQLTFYNVGRDVPLHTFCPHLKKNVCPAFSLWSAADKVQSLALCNLGTNPNNTDDADVSDVSECFSDCSVQSMPEPIYFVDVASSLSLSGQISESDQREVPSLYCAKDCIKHKKMPPHNG